MIKLAGRITSVWNFVSDTLSCNEIAKQKSHLADIAHVFSLFLFYKNSGSLTLPLIYAGMMELVDMRDLGAVTSV